MKYCKDCEHFNVRSDAPPYCGRFKREFVASESPVLGPSVQFSAPDCAVARAEKGQCGPQGRFYRARFGSPAWLDERANQRGAVIEQAREEIARPWWRFW